jgi:hypothetical protein
MFRALLAHPQEALNKRHLVYCVRGMSVGFDMFAVSLPSWHSAGIALPSLLLHSA